MLSYPPLLVDQLTAELAELAPSGAFVCESSALSHMGYIRPVNEDSYLEHAEQGLWAVADGMGGHSRGDYASKAATRALASYKRAENLADSLVLIQQKFTDANAQCLTAFRGKRIGTTVAALHMFGDLGLVIWAGDSRVYRLRRGELSQITRDHSLAEDKRQRGELSEAAAETHATAHVLTRAVGGHKRVFPELSCMALSEGDRFLLCTDGALLGASDDDLQASLSLADREEALKALVENALDSGGRDNITVMIVDVFSRAHSEQG